MFFKLFSLRNENLTFTNKKTPGHFTVMGETINNQNEKSRKSDPSDKPTSGRYFFKCKN